jgi:hypothetical protein
MTTLWPHGDPRGVANAILTDRRYHVTVRPAPKSLWDLFWEAVGRWLERLFAPVGHVFGNALLTQLVGSLVLIAVIVFLALVVVYFVRPYVRARRARTGAAASVALAGDGDAATLRARARAAAAAGRYRDAAALLWASALRALDELGRVRYDAARTPGEWRRSVGDPAFDALTRDAVVALFGDRGADAALVARMTVAYDAVVGAR